MKFLHGEVNFFQICKITMNLKIIFLKIILLIKFLNKDDDFGQVGLSTNKITQIYNNKVIFKEYLII